MRIQGGKNGILTVTRTRKTAKVSLCTAKQIAITRIDGHNGRDHNPNTRMTTPCKRKKRASAGKVCRKRTESKKAFKRCVTKVKRNRTQAKKRQAAKQRRR